MLPLLFYGIIAAGGVYAGSNAAATASELARQMREAESKLVVCSADVMDVAVEAARLAGMRRERVLVLESGEYMGLRGVDGRESVIGREEMGWERITDRKTLEESVINLLYSAGTTGLPKGVMLSHWNMVAEVCSVVTGGRREAGLRLTWNVYQGRRSRRRQSRSLEEVIRGWSTRVRVSCPCPSTCCPHCRCSGVHYTTLLCWRPVFLDGTLRFPEVPRILQETSDHVPGFCSADIPSDCEEPVGEGSFGEREICHEWRVGLPQSPFLLSLLTFRRS